MGGVGECILKVKNSVADIMHLSILGVLILCIPLGVFICCLLVAVAIVVNSWLILVGIVIVIVIVLACVIGVTGLVG